MFAVLPKLNGLKLEAPVTVTPGLVPVHTPVAAAGLVWAVLMRVFKFKGVQLTHIVVGPNNTALGVSFT